MYTDGKHKNAIVLYLKTSQYFIDYYHSKYLTAQDRASPPYQLVQSFPACSPAEHSVVDMSVQRHVQSRDLHTLKDPSLLRSFSDIQSWLNRSPLCDGNTGVGKSASGNTILGQAGFESRRSFKSVTTKISEETESVFGKQISVIDTPGILCIGAYSDIQACCEELLRSSRPCVFLVVVKIDRFTEEQHRAVEAALRVIGERGLDRTYLLFTCGDTLERTTLDEFIHEDEEGPLPQLGSRFKERYLMFNNRHGGQQQVRELLEKTAALPRPLVSLDDRRIVLFGVSGAGKSASGNRIVGSDLFRSGCDFDPVSSDCDSHSAVTWGRQVTVIDTPGFGDPKLSPQQITLKILNAIKESSLGVHAFVVVVPIGRLSDEELILLEQFPTLFGNEAPKYTMVLFTHGDKLGGRSIDEVILKSRNASSLVSMCCGRYCVFDNSQRGNRQQVRQFLDKIDEMVAANGGHPCPVDDIQRTPRTRHTAQFKILPEETPRQSARRARTFFEYIKDFIMWLVNFIQDRFPCRQGYRTFPQTYVITVC
ncbi:GTPase IMAP family member 8-like [Betta splendens]|uniref:GTPase IMAP family member 8 n=1 Tax=Betta splendens TaxID=158456 RepID=A0A9W2Y6Y9_BETSP|nr:GTPase IMAP family member 8-like [Betta splendens]